MNESVQIAQERQTQYSKAYFWNCWKLSTNKGRQYWSFEAPESIDWDSENGLEFLAQMQKAFEFDKSQNQNSADLLVRSFLGKDSQLTVDSSDLKTRAEQAAKKGFDYYQSIICEAGHQPADYGGPMFLLPGLVIASYITKTPFSVPQRALMKQYIINHQNEDGGWGLHIEGHSTMFGSVLNYVALRLLGEKTNHSAIEKGKNWIQKEGGAQSIPPWGKFYLSLLNLYDWEGNNSLFPEQWKTPTWLPTHPGRYWNHSRMVYLPMSYLYGKKFKIEADELVLELRNELYTKDYSELNWKSFRDLCHQNDQFHPVSGVMKYFNAFVNSYEKLNFGMWRKSSMSFIKKYVRSEDKQSNYINLGPVNKVLNSIIAYAEYGKDSEEFQNHVSRWKDYLWVAEDGMKMQGYNGSQFWDTVFGYQALSSGKLQHEFPKLTERYIQFIDENQILEEPNSKVEKYFRDTSNGGFPFSTRAHDWPITDCTAEGVKCLVEINNLENLNFKQVPIERLQAGVDLLLAIQNKDGGWASYEEQRGPQWLEKLNPAHIFTEIMVDYSFVECTSAVIQGLAKFNKEHSEYRSFETKTAIANAQRFIRSKQNSDGSFYGSWAVCFTYGTWFGVEGLIASGADLLDSDQPDAALQKACEFLVSKQREDGAWGESFESCVQKKYIQHESGQVVNTAWAVLALLASKYPNRAAIDKGIEFLINSQEASGDFPQQGISGVFNGNCMITYTSYRNVFPLWALGSYFNHYKD